MFLPVLCAATVAPLIAEVTPTKAERAALAFTNAERKAAGVPDLRLHPALIRASRKHAANMAKQDKLAHELDGVSFGARVAASGYVGAAGENIAHGAPTLPPKEVVDLWLGSPPHKKNLLSPDFTEVGFGVAKSANGTVYWAQMFGTRPAGK